LHYPLTTMKGAFYSRLERALMNSTDLFLLKCVARDTYQRTIGTPKGSWHVFNGVTADEFDPIVKATRYRYRLCRRIPPHQGRDLLVDAVARLRAGGKPVTLTLAATAEESENLKVQVARLGLGDAVRFIATSRRVTVFQGIAAGGPLARRFHALCRDRGGRRRHSDGRRNVAASRIFSPQHADALFATTHRRRDGGRDRDRARGSEARRRGESAARAHFSALFAEAMVDGVLAATTTHLPIVNRSLPT